MAEAGRETVPGDQPDCPGTPGVDRPYLIGEYRNEIANQEGLRQLSLLGKRVRVKLDAEVLVIGQLLGFGQGGDFEILEDDGFVHYCWPMLEIEEVRGTEERRETPEQADDESDRPDDAAQAERTAEI